MKPLTFFLIGLIIFTALVGVFYLVSRPVLAMTIVKDSPQLALFVWIIVIGMPFGFSVQVMRMVYGFSKRRKR